jgi:putative ABC transport system ATP-binding protein
MRVRAMTATVVQQRPGGGPVEDVTADAAVQVRGLSKAFETGAQRVTALRSIDWDVEPGRMSMIVGPSGCGKTTLLSIIAGVLDGDEGRVSVFGHDLAAMGDRAKTRFRARHIGFVFQQYNLLPALTAAENAAVPLVLAGWAWPRALKRAREVLDRLGMGNRTESLPSQLSGGQQQRVAISRALAHEPSLLVCDEPTAALDHQTGHAVMELLREAVVRPDRAVIVVTHDNRIFSYGDRIVHMDDGRIVKHEQRPQTPST